MSSPNWADEADSGSKKKTTKSNDKGKSRYSKRSDSDSDSDSDEKSRKKKGKSRYSKRSDSDSDSDEKSKKKKEKSKQKKKSQAKIDVLDLPTVYKKNSNQLCKDIKEISDSQKLEPCSIETVKTVVYDKEKKKEIEITFENVHFSFEGSRFFSFYPDCPLINYGPQLSQFKSTDDPSGYQIGFQLYEDINSKKQAEQDFEDGICKILDNILEHIVTLVKNGKIKCIDVDDIKTARRFSKSPIWKKYIDKEDKKKGFDLSRSPILYVIVPKNLDGDFYAKYHDYKDVKKEKALDISNLEGRRNKMVPQLALGKIFINAKTISIKFHLRFGDVKLLSRIDQIFSKIPQSKKFDFGDDSSEDEENEKSSTSSAKSTPKKGDSETDENDKRKSPAHKSMPKFVNSDSDSD